MPDDVIAPTDESTPAPVIEVTPTDDLPATQTPTSLPNLPTAERPSVEDLMAEAMKEAGIDPNTPIVDLPAVEPVVDPAIDPAVDSAIDPVVPVVDPAVDPATPVAPVVDPVVDPVAPVVDPATADETEAKRSILELLQDPANLDAALRDAASKGIENVTKIPFVEALLGRVRQSERDTISAALEKEARQTSAVSESIQKGRDAEKNLLDMMTQAEKDITDGAAKIGIPTEETLKEAAKSIKDAAVGEYHGRTWTNIGDALYELPEITAAWEMSQSTDPETRRIGIEQVNILQAKDMQPEQYLREHLRIGRDNLWRMAQAAERGKQGATWSDREKLVNAAHNQELSKLKTAHAAELETIRQSAQADALASLATKTPPKTPITQPAPQGGPKPEIHKGATISEIYAAEAAAAAAAGQT